MELWHGLSQVLNRRVGKTTWTRGWNLDGQGEDSIVVWSQDQQMAGPAGNTWVRARWAGGRGQVGHEEKGRSPGMVGLRGTTGWTWKVEGARQRAGRDCWEEPGRST